MKYISSLVLVVAMLVIATPQSTHAATDELHYQSISARFGNTILVTDKSPGGESNYTCATDGTCERTSDGVASGLKAIQTALGSVSSQGRYGTLTLPGENGGSKLVIIDFKNGFALAGTISISGSIIKQSYSPDESKLVVITNDGTVTTYTIADKTTSTITIKQTELPFFSVSYGGTYISTFNYVANVHRIWNTKTGALNEISGTPSYVEFSQSETKAAFLEKDGDFRNLSVASGFGGGSVSTQKIAHGSFTVEDYLFVGDNLYYMANKQSPLTWSIYKNSDAAPIVADHASYGDYLKRVNGMLAYLKIEGKDANVYLYDAASGTHTRLAAAPQVASESSITRKEITIAGRTAAYLAPKSAANGNLFIWLHGGPQRQTSLDYHPYLSYAVYDELLEKLAAGGNDVLKLDYSGSYGYGQKFIDSLDRHVGTIEIDDVSRAIDTFKKDHAVKNVYLIGNSYGGYMAFRALNDLHQKVNGIVSINGVADWYGLIATIPSSPFAALFGGVPDTSNFDLYKKASVFTNVDDISSKIPMLVFYGTEDKTVPTKQSVQYNEFMSANGKNVTLVPFEGEEHILHNRSTLTTLCTTITSKLSLKGMQCE